MKTSASSGRTKRLFHKKSIVTIDAIEHVFNVANSYLAYRSKAVSLVLNDLCSTKMPTLNRLGSEKLHPSRFISMQQSEIWVLCFDCL
jgi:hypothetical protein